MVYRRSGRAPEPPANSTDPWVLICAIGRGLAWALALTVLLDATRLFAALDAPLQAFARGHGASAAGSLALAWAARGGLATALAAWLLAHTRRAAVRQQADLRVELCLDELQWEQECRDAAAERAWREQGAAPSVRPAAADADRDGTAAARPGAT